MGYRQWPQQWAFYNTWKFKFTMKSFILDGFAFLGKIFNSGHCPHWCVVLATCLKFYLCTFT